MGLAESCDDRARRNAGARFFGRGGTSNVPLSSWRLSPCTTRAPTVIGIEACGASHHWARILRSFGHEAKLIAPQLVKPYVKRSRTVAAFLGQPAVADQRHRLLCATVLDRSVAEAGAAGLGGVPSRAVDGDPICIAELSRRS